jgi:tellurite resistance protein TehA-like permease
MEERRYVELSTLNYVLQNFTPIWFSICMATGLIAILLHQLPYQFHGLRVISTVVYLLNLILFILFLLIFAVRIFRHPRHALHMFGSKADELSGLACPVTAFIIIVGMTALIPGQAWGHGWTTFSYVLWWISAFLAISTFFSSLYISYTYSLPETDLVEHVMHYFQAQKCQRIVSFPSSPYLPLQQ